MRGLSAVFEPLVSVDVRATREASMLKLTTPLVPLAVILVNVLVPSNRKAPVAPAPAPYSCTPLSAPVMFCNASSCLLPNTRAFAEFGYKRILGLSAVLTGRVSLPPA